jgi:hypothetical protein
LRLLFGLYLRAIRETDVGIRANRREISQCHHRRGVRKLLCPLQCPKESERFEIASSVGQNPLAVLPILSANAATSLSQLSSVECRSCFDPPHPFIDQAPSHKLILIRVGQEPLVLLPILSANAATSLSQLSSVECRSVFRVRPLPETKPDNWLFHTSQYPILVSTPHTSWDYNRLASASRRQHLNVSVCEGN